MQIVKRIQDSVPRAAANLQKLLLQVNDSLLVSNRDTQFRKHLVNELRIAILQIEL
jgi:hypothetical protein